MPAAAEPIRDQILMLGFEQFSTAELPAGAGSEPAFLGGLAEIVALLSGRVLAGTTSGHPDYRIALKELLPDLSVRHLALVDPPPFPVVEERVEDMAVDHRGRLYLLTRALRSGSAYVYRLIEVDPVSGATLGWNEVHENIHSIATAPRGLYAYDGAQILELDPDTGRLGQPIFTLFLDALVSEIETDSAGRLWLLFSPVCSPGGGAPCIRWFDPDHRVVRPVPEAMYEQVEFLHDITIRRRCVESPTVRCLQNGRFRAEIEFSDYAGVEGVARSSAARSSDTGVFSFFQDDNWELMVKVLDGCLYNSHFWIYGAASTDVAYTLTVTDTETGAKKTYGNTLGQVAATITDNQAFSCTPADLAAAQAAAAATPAPAAGEPAGLPAALAAALAAAFSTAPEAATTPRFDELLAYQPPQGLRRASLPDGPSSPASPAAAVYALQAMADGSVLAVSDGGGDSVMLSQLRDDGTLANIGRINAPGDPALAIGAVEDMAIDGGDNLWLLGPVREGIRTMIIIDPRTAGWVYHTVVSPAITAIAGSHRGLWAAAGNEIYELSLTGYPWVDRRRIPLSGWQDVRSLDVDSTGRVYFAGHRPSCAPSCTAIGVYDPATGIVSEAPAGLPQGPVAEIAIRRRCTTSRVTHCLQQGRFRVETRFEAYDGAAGPARVAPARSADTGIFSFFNQENWEQMVKVLDGCSYNSHFWVYAAASTDVAFELEVTDTETGRQKVYRNPLGQVATTVTDNLAFSCSP